MDYFTYNASAKTLEPAPRVIVAEDRTIILGAAKDFANYLGAYPRAKRDTAPVPPAGKVAVPDGYSLVDGAWRREWRFTDALPPAPRTFSKLKCVAALIEAGLWPQVKAWIESAGLYDLYLAAQDFREDNEYFTAGKSRLQADLGLADEKVEEILSASLAD